MKLNNPNALCFLNSSINAVIQSDSIFNLLTNSSIIEQEQQKNNDNENDHENDNKNENNNDDIIKELRLLINEQSKNASNLSRLLGFEEGKQDDAAIPLEFMLNQCKEIILNKELDCGIDFGIQEQWINENNSNNNIQIVEDYILKVEKRNTLSESVASYFNTLYTRADGSKYRIQLTPFGLPKTLFILCKWRCKRNGQKDKSNYYFNSIESFSPTGEKFMLQSVVVHHGDLINHGLFVSVVSKFDNKKKKKYNWNKKGHFTCFVRTEQNFFVEIDDDTIKPVITYNELLTKIGGGEYNKDNKNNKKKKNNISLSSSTSYIFVYVKVSSDFQTETNSQNVVSLNDINK